MIVREFLQRMWHLTFFPLLDPPPRLGEPPAPSFEEVSRRMVCEIEAIIAATVADGRRFGWQRVRGGTLRAAVPVVVYDIKVGGDKEFVGDLHLMKPREYSDDLATLAERYPCPPIESD